MPDLFLAGNGQPCPAGCSGGLVRGQLGVFASAWPCPTCDGKGRVPIPPEEIIKAQIAEHEKGPR